MVGPIVAPIVAPMVGRMAVRDTAAATAEPRAGRGMVGRMAAPTVGPTVGPTAEPMAALTVGRIAAPTVGPTAVPTAALTAGRMAALTQLPAPAAARAATTWTAAPTAAQTVAQGADVEVRSGGGGAGGGPADRPALRRCTHLEPVVFAERVWGHDCSLSTREQLPGGFGDLFDLGAVDRLVSRQGLRTPFLRVARDGQTFPAARFTRGGGVGATIADQVDDAALARLFADGATIVLQGLHRTHPPLIDFSQALTRDLGHPVQINAYVTPPQSQGFSDHYDVHDVFVLQVAGEKRWLVHEPVLRHPTRNQPWTDRTAAVEAAARTEPVLDVVLRPG
ncbi:MAG: JmjC domain-containing protein, partial [Kineosporiaceae bacterium]